MTSQEQAESLLAAGKLIPIDLVVRMVEEGYDTRPYHSQIDGFSVIEIPTVSIDLLDNTTYD